MDTVSQWWSTAVVILSSIALICGLILNVPQVIQKSLFGVPKWKTNPDVYWAAFVIIFASVALGVIWTRPTPAIPRRAVLVNIKAEKLANEFRELLPDKPLSDDEKKWYREYLSVIVPAKIEEIANEKERKEYEALLTSLMAKSDDIQAHFRGLEKFVTKNRNIEVPISR